MAHQRKDNIFVDSNFFIALTNESDSHRQQAIAMSSLLDSIRVQLVISNLVFSETVTILSQ